METRTATHGQDTRVFSSLKPPTQDTTTLKDVKSTSSHAVWLHLFLSVLQASLRHGRFDGFCSNSEFTIANGSRVVWATVFDIYLYVPLTRPTRAKWRKQTSERRKHHVSISTLLRSIPKPMAFLMLLPYTTHRVFHLRYLCHMTKLSKFFDSHKYREDTFSVSGYVQLGGPFTRTFVAGVQHKRLNRLLKAWHAWSRSSGIWKTARGSSYLVTGNSSSTRYQGNKPQCKRPSKRHN